MIEIETFIFEKISHMHVSYIGTSLNPVPNAQVCVYLMIHITKLQLQTLHFQNLSIYHIPHISMGPWLLKILMFALLVTCEIATYS
jgi:hypothetical protein